METHQFAPVLEAGLEDFTIVHFRDVQQILVGADQELPKFGSFNQPKMLLEESTKEETQILDEFLVFVRSVVISFGKVWVVGQIDSNSSQIRKGAEKERKTKCRLTHFQGKERCELANDATKEVAELLVVGVANIETSDFGQTFQRHIPRERNREVLL